MNATNLTIAALLLASLTLTAAAQSAADREPSLNPSSAGVQMRSDAQRKAAGVYTVEAGKSFTVEAKCGESSKLEIRAFAKDDDASKKNLAAEFLPLGGSVAWTGRLPASMAGRTVIFQARARTLTGKTYTTNIEVNVGADRSSDPQPKPQPGNGDDAADGGRGSSGDDAKDDPNSDKGGQGSSTRPNPGLGGNAR